MNPDSDKPTIELNLDAFMREADLAPFNVVWQGQRYTMAHASELAAFDLLRSLVEAGQGGIETLTRLALGDQFEAFAATNPPLGAVQQLLAKWIEHSGLNQGN